MIYYWLGIYFFSVLGMFLHPVYGAVDSKAWIALLGLGVAATVAGFYRGASAGDNPAAKKMLVFLVPVLAGMLAFGFPYNLPFFVLGAGVVISMLAANKIFRSLAGGMILSGLIYGLQTACIVPYFKVAARYHQVNFFTPLFYWLLKGLGIPCAYSQDTIFAQTARSVLSLVTTWEKLGLYFGITFFAGALVLICVLPKRTGIAQKLKQAGIVVAGLVIYSIIRYVFLCVVFIDIGRVEIFWEPLIVACSYLPFPFMLTKFIKQDRASPNFMPLNLFSKKEFTAGIASFLFFFALAGYCWFQDPGVLKKGRVLVDEYYSNWEWTERKLDTRWYGIQSVYNYYNMGAYLRHFYSVKTLKQPVTGKLLSEYDVFFVKTPTRAFTAAEIETIVEFTRKGGGVFLIGDHTNVFGTTININPLAEKYGVRFNYDATYNLRTNDLHFHEPKTLFKHPAVQQMPYFLFATSCSIEAPLAAEDVITATNLKTIYLDYSRGGYFPDKKTEQNYTFGPFLQSVGVKFGRGRMLAFSDSTCFSNFYMHIPGKPQYLLGSINWLNRVNRYDKPAKVFFIFIMIAAAGFIVFVKYKKQSDEKTSGLQFPGLVLFWGVLGLSAGALLFNYFSGVHYSLPQEHKPMKKVGFEESYCDFNIPSRKLLHNPSIDYHTFYVWTQRLGYIPDLFSLQDSAMDKYDVNVFVNPEKNFSEKDLTKIEKYLNKGGRLLIMDNPENKKSTANQLAERFGFNFLYKRYQKGAEIRDGSLVVGKVKSFVPVKGGSPLLFSGEKDAFVSTLQVGKGRIAFAGCASSFTNKEMGETEAVPDDHQLFLYKLEFWLLKGLMQNKFDSFAEFAY